jgi:threonine synthase
MCVSMAKALGATDVCLPSAGNAGSALAAYAAAAGLKAHVFLPRDIARLFVMETEAYGAHVEMVDGLITDAGRVCAAQAKEHGWYECATLKEPYRVEGKKTMGYEIAEQLDWTLPDAILYPTGGGTGLVGMWKAFAEMEAMGFVGSKRPRMYADPGRGLRADRESVPGGQGRRPDVGGRHDPRPRLARPKALADFIILRDLRESHGAAIAVSEAEIVAGVKQAPGLRASSWPPRAAPASPRPASSSRAATSRPTTRSSSSTPAPATSTWRTWRRSGDLAGAKLSARGFPRHGDVLAAEP